MKRLKLFLGISTFLFVFFLPVIIAGGKPDSAAVKSDTTISVKVELNQIKNQENYLQEEFKSLELRRQFLESLAQDSLRIKK